MKKLLLIASALLFFHAGDAEAVQALDGANQAVANTGSTGTGLVSVALTTTQSNDVIIILVQGSSTASTSFSISGTGLSSIAQRGTDQIGSGTRFSVFKAIAASPLSAVTITATVNGWGGFGFFTIFAFAISGSNISTVFDSNVSLPAVETTSVAAAGSTSNANDFVFAAYSDGVGTAGAGWTQILNNSLSFSVEYQVVSSAGAFAGNLSPNNNNSIVGVLDAVMQASSATVIPGPLMQIGPMIGVH